MSENLNREVYDNSTAANAIIIRRRANRRGYSISHRAFRPNGQINRELWWFGDKGYRLISPVKELSEREALEWLDKNKEK